MSLSFGISPLLLIPCVLAALGLGYWVYLNTVPTLSQAKRLGLTALRTLTLSIVLFLLFKPMLQNIINTEQPPLLAVLIDDSQSLEIAIEEESDTLRISEETRATVRRYAAENVDGSVRYFRFSGDVNQLGSSDPDSLRFDGERTNVANALAYVREQYKDENLQGGVVDFRWAV